jgi:hypothetical protein
MIELAGASARAAEISAAFVKSNGHEQRSGCFSKRFNRNAAVRGASHFAATALDRSSSPLSIPLKKRNNPATKLQCDHQLAAPRRPTLHQLRQRLFF